MRNFLFLLLIMLICTLLTDIELGYGLAFIGGWSLIYLINYIDIQYDKKKRGIEK